MTGDIRRSGVSDADYLLGQAKNGKRYRLTVEDHGIRRSGIVRAEVAAPRVEYIPGKVTFILEGDALNESDLYAGPIGNIVALEEIA